MKFQQIIHYENLLTLQFQFFNTLLRKFRFLISGYGKGSNCSVFYSLVCNSLKFLVSIHILAILHLGSGQISVLANDAIPVAGTSMQFAGSTAEAVALRDSGGDLEVAGAKSW